MNAFPVLFFGAIGVTLLLLATSLQPASHTQHIIGAVIREQVPR